MQADHVKISKFLSLILRHKPETIGIALDAQGWADVDELLQKSAKNGRTFSRQVLKEVVHSNDKQRFVLSDDGKQIRAAQGHSLDLDIQFEQQTPPALLFHGTAERNIEAILAQGLNKMARHHVHLSADRETALKVGVRYGKPVILHVDSAIMSQHGYEFYLSSNGVWLTDHVPAEFLAVEQ